MECPICGSKTTVIDTADVGERVLRERKCLNPQCRFKFNTEEIDRAGDKTIQRELNNWRYNRVLERKAKAKEKEKAGVC